jgi:hypothetical protein
MLNDILTQIKKHPIASVVYIIYLLFWFWMCYFTYSGLTTGDDDILSTVLFYTYLFACVPYLIVNLLLAWYYKTKSEFYKEMAMLIVIPMGLVILVLIEHNVIGYFNKGV